MNALDIIIIALSFSAIFRGYEIGLVRQLFSTIGFFIGLFIGAELQKFTVTFAHTALSKSIVTLVTTLGCAMLLLWAGEVLGVSLKYRIQRAIQLNKFDGWIGSVVGVVTLLGSIWLAASVVLSIPSDFTQAQIRSSAVISYLDQHLPSTPGVIASLGKLIDPNGFPQVFTGAEPNLGANTTVPGISVKLQQAIDRDKASVVKVEGLGCGGIVDGSGFVVGPGLVATNAHVVAGVRHPYVKDAVGQHSAQAVWFDPELDFAVLHVQNLSESPLLISYGIADSTSTAAVLGYPGGGSLKAGGAKILDNFTARGRDIYGQGVTERSVYSLAATIIPGNSGGPLISDDGSVIGVVFAQSTVYQNVGYALTSPQIQNAISQAQAQNRTVATGSCAE